VLREAENLAGPMARAKNLKLSLHIDGDVPTCVVGDDKRLLQTLLNLVGNGVSVFFRLPAGDVK
jgi:ethylene receptor